MPLPPSWDLPDPGFEPESPALPDGFFTTEPGKPRKDTGKRKAHLETLCKEMEAVGDYHVTCLNSKEIFLIQIFLAKVKVIQEC